MTDRCIDSDIEPDIIFFHTHGAVLVSTILSHTPKSKITQITIKSSQKQMAPSFPNTVTLIKASAAQLSVQYHQFMQLDCAMCSNSLMTLMIIDCSMSLL
jgi:hypothetical protein